MRWMRIIVAVLAFAVAGWFVTDGTIAMVTGDYVTPGSGEYAGQLAPWSKLVASAGIEPRSTLMKLIFVVYGALWLIVIALFLLGRDYARRLMLIAAIGSLWYIPFGAVLGVIQITLLLKGTSARG